MPATFPKLTIVPIAATATSLSGFRITCDCCAYDQTCSIETLAREWAREHHDWHTGAVLLKRRR